MAFFIGNTTINAQYQTYDRNAAIEKEKQDTQKKKTTTSKTTSKGTEEFNFELAFGNFSILQSLQSQIALSQLSRKKIDDWLRKQENTTLLKEMNKQMGKNYSSFATAQREYFKFYEGGKYGNLGPVARARRLGSQISSSAKNWEDKAKNYQKEHIILDKWISCGFCGEYSSMAYEVKSLEKYDNDNSPGPKFYAKVFRDGAFKSFGNAFYNSGLSKSLSIGLSEMAEKNNDLLTRISDKRVAHYRSLGWQEKVFQMSAYLVSKNTNCPSPVLSCLPSNLAKYRPIPAWSDNTLKEWAKEFSPSIPKEQFIFGNDYLNSQINLLTTGSYGVWSRAAVIEKVEKERDDLANAYLAIPQENQICGGLVWSEIGDSYYTTMTGLRLKAKLTLFGFQIGPEETIPIQDICVQTPNFNKVGTKEIKLPSHVATTRIKIAWETAVAALLIDEKVAKKPLTPLQYAAALTRNLNISLQGLRVGSTASVGDCPGSALSRVRFCKN